MILYDRKKAYQCFHVESKHPISKNKLSLLSYENNKLVYFPGINSIIPSKLFMKLCVHVIKAEKRQIRVIGIN